MEIRKFKHVANNKIMYAVIGTEDGKQAMDYVYKYKKAEYIDFYINHDWIYGSIYKNNLYVGTVLDAPLNKQTPCIIVYRKTIDIENYA